MRSFTTMVLWLIVLATGRQTSLAQALMPEVTVPIPSSAGSNLSSYWTADVDGSGFLDVLWSDGNSVFYHADPGAGGGWNPGPLITLFTPPTLNPPVYGLNPEPVDLTGDGILDLLGIGPTLYLFPGLPGGGFAPAQNLATMTPLPMGSLDFGDFDGDGAQDLIINRSGLPFPQASTPPLEVWLNRGASFVLAANEPIEFVSRTYVADYDQDGNDDIVLRDPAGLYRILRGNASGVLAPAVLLPASLSTATVLGGEVDLNGDSYPDLIATSFGPAPFYVLQNFHLAAGSPTTGLALGPPLLLPRPFSFGSGLWAFPGGDFDGDGRPELLTVTTSLQGSSAMNPAEIHLQRFDDLGALSSSIQLRSYPYALNAFLREDFDNDGDTDLATIFFDGVQLIYSYNESLGIYGSACSGTSGDPVFTMGAAVSGNVNYNLGLRNARPNSLAALFVSTQPSTSLNCGALIDLAPASLIGPQGVFGTFMTDAQGEVDLFAPIPSVPSAVAPFYAQWAVQDPIGAYALGTQNLATTAARLIRIF